MSKKLIHRVKKLFNRYSYGDFSIFKKIMPLWSCILLNRNCLVALFLSYWFCVCVYIYKSVGAIYCMLVETGRQLWGVGSCFSPSETESFISAPGCVVQPGRSTCLWVTLPPLPSSSLQESWDYNCRPSVWPYVISSHWAPAVKFGQAWSLRGSFHSWLSPQMLAGIENLHGIKRIMI